MFRRNQAGFTVLELMVAILVVGILGVVMFGAVSNSRLETRDQQRRADVETIARHLENYYVNNDTYPAVGQMTDQAWVAENMPELAQVPIADPQGDENSFGIAAETGAGVYAYEGAGCTEPPEDGSEADNLGCGAYRLTATLEGEEFGQTTHVVNSLNGQELFTAEEEAETEE